MAWNDGQLKWRTEIVKVDGDTGEILTNLLNYDYKKSTTTTRIVNDRWGVKTITKIYERTKQLGVFDIS